MRNSKDTHMKKTYDTIIISGGNIEQDFALAFLEKNRDAFLIAADAGMRFLEQNNILPDLAIGDFDSITPEAEKRMAELEKDGLRVIRLRPEKDVSDTQAAFLHAVENGSRRIALLGCTGTRLDHVAANISLLVLAREAGGEAVILDSHNRISLVLPGTELKKEEVKSRYVSFFPFGGDVTGLTLTGFKYPLRDFLLRPRDSGLTVSNEIAAETAVVRYASGNLIMIESSD